MPSVGPGADPGVQTVSPQVTIRHLPGGRLSSLSARRLPFQTQIITSLGRYQVILLDDEHSNKVGSYRYDTVNLRALKRCRDGQLNLAHGIETKK